MEATYTEEISVSRTRDKGYSTSSYPLPLASGVLYQTRSHYDKKWIKEFREIPISRARTYTYYSNICSITDEVGKRGLFNPVYHVKRYGTNVDLSEFTWKAATPAWPNPSETWITYGETRHSCVVPDLTGYASSLDISSVLPAFPSADWNELVASVGDRLDGSMQASNNMLVELAQVGQTLGMLKNPFSVRSIKHARKWKLTLSQLAKTSASAWLEYRYGWRNLHLCLKSLSSAFGEVRRHMEHLRESSQKFTSLSASSVVSPAWTGTFGVNTGVDVNLCQIWAEKARVDRKYTFSLDVMRPEHALRWSEIDLLQQRLGTNDVLEALWDLVPFSFVVDWFVHIDKWIKRDPIFWGGQNLRRIGYSVKTSAYVKFHLRQRILTSYGYSPYREVVTDPVLVLEQYQRTPGFPPATESAGFFSSLNKTQLADGAALIVQRLP